MPACVFFGNTNEKDITFEMYEALRDLFEFLIVKKEVKLFYTTAKTDFDSMCESVIGSLRNKYEDIELVKIAGKDDKKQRSDLSYDRIINFENNNYIKRCIHTSRLAEFMLFDTIVSSGPKDNLFVDIMMANYHRLDDINVIDLKRFMKIEDNQYN